MIHVSKYYRDQIPSTKKNIQNNKNIWTFINYVYVPKCKQTFSLDRLKLYTLYIHLTCKMSGLYRYRKR